MVKKIFPIIIVVLFSFIAVFSLLHKGLPPTHDGEYHIVRFYEFDKVLRDGDWYPRWQPDMNNGYGSPLSNYYYPLPNYIASSMHVFGLSFIDSFKWQMILSTIIGGIFFFLWMRTLFGNIVGVVSSLAYIYSPYRFVEVFVRGAVGEAWSLALFPALLWSLTKIIQTKRTGYIGISGVILFLLILSHNILAYMLIPFGIIYAIFLIFFEKKRKRISLYVFISLLFGVGLAAIFWMPALFERQYARGLQIFDIESHFPELYQLIFPSWGSGFSNYNLATQISFQVGIVNLLGVLINTVFVMKGLIGKKCIKLRLFFLVWFCIIFFLMNKESLPIWRGLPFMNYFQFPWRFLALEIIISAALIGLIFSEPLFTKFPLIKLSVSVLIIFSSIMLGIGYSKPAYYHDREDSFYFTKSNFMNGTNTPGNAFNTIWMNESISKNSRKIDNPDVAIKNQIIISTSYSFDLFIKKKKNIVINTAYFPGWTAFIDGKKTDIDKNKDGLISVMMPKGNHTLAVKLINTPIRTMASLLSLLTLMILIVFSFLKFKKYPTVVV